MLKELEKVELKGSLVFKNGNAYSYIQDLNKYTEIDGCEYFKSQNEKHGILITKKAELEKQLAELENEIQNSKREMLDLEINGYCPINEKAYTRIGGVVTNEYYTHKKECKHKGE